MNDSNSDSENDESEAKNGETEEDRPKSESPDLNMFRKTAFYKPPPFSPIGQNKSESIYEDDDDDYPNEFDFLNEWKKEKVGKRW